MKSTMIYFRDANATSNTAPQVRFETYKTSRKNRFNVTVHDTEIQEKNHASYFEEKTNKEKAAERSKPKAKIDF